MGTSTSLISNPPAPCSPCRSQYFLQTLKFTMWIPAGPQLVVCPSSAQIRKGLEQILDAVPPPPRGYLSHLQITCVCLTKSTTISSSCSFTQPACHFLIHQFPSPTCPGLLGSPPSLLPGNLFYYFIKNLPNVYFSSIFHSTCEEY